MEKQATTKTHRLIKQISFASNYILDRQVLRNEKKIIAIDVTILRYITKNHRIKE